MRSLLVLLGLSYSAISLAQDIGGLPPLNWRLLNGKGVDVISTPALEPFARRTLQLQEGLIDLKPLSLGNKVVPIDVVIQPLTVVPNGFVGMTPWRSFLFATPPQDQALLSSNSWVDALAIHEYRHVEQSSNLLRGWTRAARVIFGNAGWSVATGLSTPDWFSEGDAVYAETALTYAGRGRTPAFTALQRALALDSIQYSYAKARNGSFRSRVPNHYPLGFALVQHGRQVHENPWPEVVKGAGNFWPPFYPFSLALKQATGLRTTAFYHQAYDSLGTVWRAAASAKTHTPTSRFGGELRQLATYALPQASVTTTGNLVALRQSQVDIPALVEISPEGQLLHLANFGVNVDDQFHVAAGKAVWTQVQLNPLRPNESYSNIVLLDLAAGGEVQRLTHNAQLFSPGLSPDGSHLIAAQAPQYDATSSKSVESCLLEFETQSAQQTRKLCFDAELLISPRYTSSAQELVVIAKRKSFLALVKLDFGGKATALTPWTRHVIGTPFVSDSAVYFSASFTGIDNIFEVPLDGSQNIRQLTDVEVGAYGPNVVGQRLYFTEVTPQGDPISFLDKKDWLSRSFDLVDLHQLDQYAALEPTGAAQLYRSQYFDAEATFSQVLATAPEQKPSEENEEITEFGQAYHSILKGFQLHSLQPRINQREASISAIGQTILGDLATEAQVGFNYNEREFFGSASLTYARSWPWLEVELAQFDRSYTRLNADSLRFESFEFQQQSFALGLSAPLNQQLGAYNWSLTPTLTLRAYHVANLDQRESLAFSNSTFIAPKLQLRAQRLRAQAAKHILPRGGQTLDLAYERSLTQVDASQVRLGVGQLLPGFHPSHTTYLRLGYRHELLGNPYQFPDRFAYARGYEKVPSDGSSTVSIDYHFPILYPDVGFAGIIYARRLRANVWADAMQLDYRLPIQRSRDRLASAGIDFTLDAIFFNVESLPIGIRFAYLFEQDFLNINAKGWAQPQLLIALPL